ncbi:hypothetical protein LshimejAT787_0404210 [Lyophyllum shimeji]|uniref:Uncharacterized protein n=1 Tax=Lyophyllum shimeji TaxID=47721 RepID=A0A9P3PK32_LYOSH|nr:hypothetical protein LshimejAT787_0404210 [Lyophyllum shimeji]
MSVRFCTFRRILLGLIAVLSCVSIGLSIPLLPCLRHRKVLWTIVPIQGACLIRSSWSALRKPVLKHEQSVARETIELFLLVPFELVLALVTATSPLEREDGPRVLPLVLQVFILVNTIINLSYSAGLFLTTLLTSAAFDSDIWLRDIDSSPSPFPIPILLVFMFPFLSRWYSPPRTPDSSDEAHQAEPLHCLPGCQCTTKAHPFIANDPPVEVTDPCLAGTSSFRSSNRGSISGSLVRIPNAIERRMSIAIAFEV